MNPPASRPSLPRFLLPAIPVVFAGAAPAAHAVVISFSNFGLTTTTVTSGGTDNLYFNLTTGETGNTSFAGADFYLKHFFGASATPAVGTYSPYVGVATDGNYAARSLSGGSVDASASWNSGNWFLNQSNGNDANWPAGPSHGFLGLRVSSNTGFNYNYGWAEVSFNADDSLTLYAFGYETDPDTAILAGDTGISAVPEPATTAVATGLTALLAGSAALYAKRRRKKSTEPLAA